MDLNASAAGVWKDRNGQVIDPTTYRVVPGDKLTYTQPLVLTLVGDKLSANLNASALTGTGTFAPSDISVPASVTLTDSAGDPIANPLTSAANNGETVTATASFEFLSTTTNRSSTTATYNLSDVSFSLQQIQTDGLQ